MREKAKQFLCLTIIALLVLTMMPPVLFESFAETTASGSEVEKIEKFQAKLVRGTDSDSSTTWTPTTNADGHRFVYRISYAFSGVGELPKESVKIRVPKKLIRDRSGKYNDEFDVGVPEERDADENDDFAYREGSGDDKDYYIVYNNREISAAQTGSIDVSYSLKNKVSQYKDMQDSDRFKADIQVDNNGTKVTADTEADPVRVNTSVSITGTSKRVPNGYFYRTWEDRWGEKPSDADDYYYLVWEIKSRIKPHSTQPYNFTLNDTFDNGDVVAYKFEGGDGFQKSNTLKNITPSGGDYNDRYDYVLTRHKKSTYQPKNSYTVYNHVTAVVSPVDLVDSETSAKANASWYYEKPVYEKPTGHFYSEKYGLTNTRSQEDLTDTQQGYTVPYYKEDHGRFYVVGGSEDISDFSLTEFKKGKANRIDNLRYYSYVRGYPYPWTLPEGKTGDNPSDYGKENVTYQLTDNKVELKDTQLKAGDYEMTALAFHAYSYAAAFDEDTQQFHMTGKTDPTDKDVLTFYVEKGGDGKFVKAAEYNLKTKSYSDVNQLYVSGTSEDLLSFTSGITGYRIVTKNAYYFTMINAYPNISVLNSDSVKNLVGTDDKIRLKNTSVGSVLDHNGKQLFSRTMSASDYIMGIKRDSSLQKTIVGTRNNKKKKQYTVSWRIAMSESYRDNEGRHETSQSSGTFYDLLPKNSSLDMDSVEVRSESTVLSPSEYSLETKQNYRGSGRTLLIIRIKTSGTKYNFTFDTVHPWDDLSEVKFNIYNSAVYETGNDDIADGLKDTGGAGQDQKILKDLDPDTDGEKFLYAQDWQLASLVTATTSGLNKKVRAKEDKDYSYSTMTYSNDSYEYRLRFANDDDTISKNIILFDSLENYVTPEGKASDWHGILKDVDKARLNQIGVAPVFYYSSEENLDIYLHHDLDEVKDGKKIWLPSSEFGDISNAKAVAIDCSRGTNGGAFALGTGESLSTILYMQSPLKVSGKNLVAYNNIFISKDSVSKDGSVSHDLVHQDYTQLKYRVVADVNLRKVKESAPEEGIPGISFRLYGTSDYEDDIDMTAASGSDGTLTFKRIPTGTYKLQELGGSDDWLVDRDQKTVRIDENGLVTISDITAKDGVWQFPDKPRVHGDLTAYKRSSVRSKEADAAITALKAAGEGNTVTIDGKEFTVVSYRADKSAAEVKPSDGASLGEDTPVLNALLVKTLSTGNLLLSFKSGSALSIPDTAFHLSGTSDYGNDVSMDGVTDLTGKLVLKNIEKGTYTLKESQANEDYILNPAEWTVTVDENGNAGIQDAEMDNGYPVLRNEPRYHDFSLRKVDAENTSQWLSGAEFHLQGVSDIGNSVDKTAAADDTGLAEFLDLEKGSYILTETKAPEHHQLDAKSYIVTVTAFGDVYVDGLSMDEDGHFTFPDKRTLDGKITITKKWADNKSNDNRPVPKVHLTTKKPWYEKQAYAVYDSGDQSMTFFRDAKGKYTDGQMDGTKTYYTGFEDITGETDPSWYDSSSDDQKNKIKTVTFKDKIKPKTCYDWFCHASSLVSITGLDKLDTAAVTDMNGMFTGCRSLTSLDVSSFNTANVTDMNYMFAGCSSLTSLYLSSFNTAAVTDMRDMFKGCSSLTSLDLSSFNTKNVTKMDGMFSGCSSLTSLDLSRFNTENVKDMSFMFSYCSSLTSLDLSRFNTAAVTDMSSMFDNCSSITSLDVSSFDTENVKKMGQMFMSCSSLTSLDLSRFNTENVTNMWSMFNGCSKLTSLDLSRFNTENVTSMVSMFNGCSKLTSLNLSSFDTENVTDMYRMFNGCSSLTSLDVSSFNTAAVTNMENMFSYCSKLKTIYASSLFTTNAVSSSYIMFYESTSLVGGAGTKYGPTDKTYARIDGGTSRPGYFTAKAASAKTAPVAAKASLLSASLANANSILQANKTIKSQEVNTSESSAAPAKRTVLRAAANTTLTGQAYAVYDSTDQSMTFFRDTAGKYTDGQVNGTKTYYTGFEDDTRNAAPSWVDLNFISGDLKQKNTIKTITFKDKIQPKTCSFWFCFASSLTSITGLDKLDTATVTNMSGMFAFCSSLTSLDVSSFNTAAVTNMGGMFSNCSKLKTIYASSLFTTNAVSSSDGMFDGCTSLVGGAGTKYNGNYTDGTYAKIDDGTNNPGYFTAETVTSSSQAYAVYDSTDQSMTFFRDTPGKYTDGQVSGTKTYYTGFEDITGETYPSWYDSKNYRQKNTIKTVVFKDKISPKTCYSWFYDASSLTSITGLDKLDTENVTDMKWMFYICSSLTSLDLSSFNTAAVTDMSRMFQSCRSLTSLNVSSFNTANVTNMDLMFGGCSSLTSLDLSSFNTENVTNMSDMFSNCYNLASLDLSSFNTENVTNMESMFQSCSSLTSLNVSSFNTAAVTDMSGMFLGCSLTSLDLSSFNTTAVTNMENMFTHCYSLNTLVLSSKFTKTSDDARLPGNWNRIATTSGRKVAKTAAISGSSLMSTYDGNTMSGIWQKEGTPESASPIDIFEEYVTDDNKWTKNDDGTWTYTFDVYDDASKFYAYEEGTKGYVSSSDDSN